jgi:hypothetical protein
MTNPSLPDVVKIGFTMKDPEIRRRELSGTSLPHEYQVVYEVLIDDPFEIEKIVHASLDYCRVNKGREFFRIRIDAALSCINFVLSQRNGGRRYYENGISSVHEVESNNEEICRAIQWSGHPAISRRLCGWDFLCVSAEQNVVDDIESFNHLGHQHDLILMAHLAGPMSPSGIRALGYCQFIGLHDETDEDIWALKNMLKSTQCRLQFARISSKCLDAFSVSGRRMDFIYLHDFDIGDSSEYIVLDIPSCARSLHIEDRLGKYVSSLHVASRLDTLHIDQVHDWGIIEDIIIKKRRANNFYCLDSPFPSSTVCNLDTIMSSLQEIGLCLDDQSPLPVRYLHKISELSAKWTDLSPERMRFIRSLPNLKFLRINSNLSLEGENLLLQSLQPSTDFVQFRFQSGSALRNIGGSIHNDEAPQFSRNKYLFESKREFFKQRGLQEIDVWFG